MDKFVAVVVPDETKAYECINALQELHNEGSVSVYATAVVQREPKGTLSVKQMSDDGPVGTALGALLGSMIGLIGGPVGAIAGGASGGLIGTWGQYGVHAEVSEEFAEDFGRNLKPGNFAVLAEVDEEWTAPVDTRLGQLGLTAVRASREAFADDLMQRRVDADRAELEKVKTNIQTDIASDKSAAKSAVEKEVARIKTNVEDAKAIDKKNLANLETKIATKRAEGMEAALEHELQSTTEKLRRRAEKTQERLDQRQGEMDAKVRRLEEQASKAKPEVGTRIQQRIDALRKEYGERLEKLRRAYEMTQEALRA